MQTLVCVLSDIRSGVFVLLVPLLACTAYSKGDQCLSVCFSSQHYSSYSFCPISMKVAYISMCQCGENCGIHFKNYPLNIFGEFFKFRTGTYSVVQCK